MTYEQAREFAKDAQKAGSVLGLTNIRNLMRELGDVQDKLPIIHIAGTNGKGSVGAYLDSIFRAGGLHVGRFCSPAVFTPLEVWQYDGENISKEEYAMVMSQVKSACDIMVSKGCGMPTLFEIETAAAFVWFSIKQPDMVLLEAGMGGLTDATNIVKKPLCSVITKIGYDHMQFLGETLAEIAEIKSGIIKEGCPVYSAPQEPEVEEIIRKKAQKMHSPIGVVKQEKLKQLVMDPEEIKFLYKGIIFESQMVGKFQMQNMALAAKVAFYRLRDFHRNMDYMGMLNICMIVNGIKKAKWPGRFEIIRREPYFIIDGAHNEDGARALAETVKECFKGQKINYIVGVFADKEYEAILQIMKDSCAKLIAVSPDHPRALPNKKLAEAAQKYYREVVCCDSLKEAAEQAKEGQRPVLAFGSLSYLGELRKVVTGKCK